MPSPQGLATMSRLGARASGSPALESLFPYGVRWKDTKAETATVPATSVSVPVVQQAATPLSLSSISGLGGSSTARGTGGRGAPFSREVTARERVQDALSGGLSPLETAGFLTAPFTAMANPASLVDTFTRGLSLANANRKITSGFTDAELSELAGTGNMDAMSAAQLAEQAYAARQESIPGKERFLGDAARVLSGQGLFQALASRLGKDMLGYTATKPGAYEDNLSYALEDAAMTPATVGSYAKAGMGAYGPSFYGGQGSLYGGTAGFGRSGSARAGAGDYGDEGPSAGMGAPPSGAYAGMGAPEEGPSAGMGGFTGNVSVAPLGGYPAQTGFGFGDNPEVATFTNSYLSSINSMFGGGGGGYGDTGLGAIGDPGGSYGNHDATGRGGYSGGSKRGSTVSISSSRGGTPAGMSGAGTGDG